MIKVGIVGSSGYVAGELIRCLLHHPEVEIDFLYSHTYKGKKVNEVHQDLFYNDSLMFSDKLNLDIDVLFLCLGHGNSKKFLEQYQFSTQTKCIDLSNDFRLNSNANFQDKSFVYGLVELNKSKVKEASNIANPGCFATAIQLGLLPLAKEKLLLSDVHVNAITGSTGAGRDFSSTTHFSWRNSNASIYKPFEHQHLDEITESVNSFQSNFTSEINFIPVRGNFTRGIHASIYLNSDISQNVLNELYDDYYHAEEFTHVSEYDLHLKQVINTNHCALRLQKIKGKILITSVIDNLLKGAAGQAIQNMNLLFDFSESTGLNFKSNYF